VNEVLQEAAEGPLKGILEYSDLPLVSCDYRGQKRCNLSNSPCSPSLLIFMDACGDCHFDCRQGGDGDECRD